MKTLPTLRSIARRRQRRRTLLAGALTSVLVATACGGSTMNFSQDAQFSPDMGITDGGDPLMLGKRHFANRNFGLAIEEFEQARVLAPQSVNVLNALAVAYEEIGRSDIADSYFLEALDVDPSSAQTYNNWAMVHLGRGNKEKAAQLLAEAARLSPGDPMVAGNIARVDATNQGDQTIQDADSATGSLTAVIAELQPNPEDWTPTIQPVAPHVSFLNTTPPGGALAAVDGDNEIPTVLYPQVAAADIAPMPDPSIEQAPPPPAVPVTPVVEFELDNPAAADAALIALATAEAGRTIVPVGASSAESADGGGRVIRPGGGAVVTVVEEPEAMLASLPAPLREQAIQPGAVIVSAELLPADLPQSVGVGSWARVDAPGISSAAEDAVGEIVTIASIPADAAVIRPGADPADAAPGAKLIGVGETVEPTIVDPARVIVPVPAWPAEVGSTDRPALAPVAAEAAVAVAVLSEPDTVEIVPEAPVAVAVQSEPDAIDAAVDNDIKLAAFAPMSAGVDLRPMPAVLTASAEDEDAFLSVAAVLPPSNPVVPVVADASARVPVIVAVFAGPEPVAPETAVADNTGATSLPLASAARIPSVVAVLAMVEAGTGDGSSDAESGIDE
jgi:tetratricopeptide (TPR) repeat protein